MITGGSAFNIKAKSLRLGDFTRHDVDRLYAQHTQETGQIFGPEAMAQAWDMTQGQPWLVNA
ncbi:MAG TPA: ATP-binding protein, partial [Armatimonadota bacterium]|nr:ATP-binding protein [Armatimonadota bacterium]